MLSFTAGIKLFEFGMFHPELERSFSVSIKKLMKSTARNFTDVFQAILLQLTRSSGSLSFEEMDSHFTSLISNLYSKCKF